VSDGVDRRRFLQGGAAALGGAALALGGRAVWDETRSAAEAAERPDAVGRATEPSDGPRQAGVSTVPQAFATWVALDVLDGVDRAALTRLMRIWTDDIARLTRGRPGLADTEPELATVPARLTVTLGLGPGVFAAADREHLRPAWLAPLPVFSVDRLEDRWSGGDLVLQVCADDELTISHAVRLLTKGARTFVRVRWTQRGFRSSPGSVPPGSTMRNLMGQLDGTVNPVPGADDDIVWHGSEAPAWLVGGTSMVIRRIAMDLDTWDVVDRGGREFTIGRRLDTGAPLTGSREHDVPDLDAVDELGLPVIDPAAHVRRARTGDARERILRRGYNFDDATGTTATDSGLVFVAFQRDVTAQYLPLQRRLDELDLLNRWTTPVGSAVFAVPGGTRTGEHLAQRLLEPGTG